MNTITSSLEDFKCKVYDFRGWYRELLEIYQESDNYDEETYHKMTKAYWDMFHSFNNLVSEINKEDVKNV